MLQTSILKVVFGFKLDIFDLTLRIKIRKLPKFFKMIEKTNKTHKNKRLNTINQFITTSNLFFIII